MIEAKISADDLALYEILRNPCLCAEFIFNIDLDPRYDEEYHNNVYQNETLADFNDHVSMCTARAVGKTRTDVSLIMWILSFNVFPGDYALFVVPSKVHLQPVWDGLMRGFRSNSFMMNFVKRNEGINSSDNIITCLNGATLYCRIAGQSGTGSNLVGLHTPFIMVDEGGYFPWAAFQEMQPDLNVFTAGHREIVTGVPTGLREKNVLYHVDQVADNFSKHRVTAFENPRNTPKDLENFREQYGGEDTEDYLHYCFTPETEIITNAGFKKISEIKANDTVLTHKGNWKKVIRTFEREYNGEIIEIKTEKSQDYIRCTPDHPLYGINLKKVTWSRNNTYAIWKGNLQKKSRLNSIRELLPEFKPAAKFEKLDRLAFPKFSFSDMFPDYLDFSDFGVVKGDGFVYHETNGINGSKRLVGKFPVGMELDDDMLFFLGLFIAEGSNHETRFQCAISLNKKETNLINRATKVLDLFGLRWNISKTLGNGIQIVFSSPIFSKFVSRYIGHEAVNKHIPEFLLGYSSSRLLPLLEGLFAGDGWIGAKKNALRASYTTISKRLSNDILFILKGFGINPATYTVEEHLSDFKTYKSQSHEAYTIELNHKEISTIYNNKVYTFDTFDNGDLAIPIKDLRKSEYNGLVYNLEVEDDNSYVTKNFSVHNCLGQHGQPVFALFDRNLFKIEQYPVIRLEIDGTKDTPVEMFTKIETFPSMGEKNYGIILGIDLGYTEPTAINILYLDGNDKIRFHGRIRATKVSYPIQEKIIDILMNRFKPFIIGVDEGQAGKSVRQHLLEEPQYQNNIYKEILMPIDFSSWTSMGTDQDGNEIKMKTKPFTVSLLQDYTNNHKIIYSHTDPDMIVELERMTYTKNPNGDIAYRTLTERGGKRGEDHFTSALLCGVAAYYFAREHNINKPRVRLARPTWVA